MLREIIDWGEAWAPLIPLAVMLVHRNKAPYLKPVRIYVVLALVINLVATLIWKRLKLHLNLPAYIDTNTFLYNLNSIVRLLCFSWFFILLRQRFLHRVKLAIPFLFIVFVLVNFIFFEKFYSYNISSLVLATEAALLLFYCLQYYIYRMLQDRGTPLIKQPGFWLVTALTFYAAINFFIFLLYNYLTNENQTFAVDIWDVQIVLFILLCIAIAVTLKNDND